MGRRDTQPPPNDGDFGAKEIGFPLDWRRISGKIRWGIRDGVQGLPQPASHPWGQFRYSPGTPYKGRWRFSFHRASIAKVRLK